MIFIHIFCYLRLRKLLVEMACMGWVVSGEGNADEGVSERFFFILFVIVYSNYFDKWIFNFKSQILNILIPTCHWYIKGRDFSISYPAPGGENIE